MADFPYFISFFFSQLIKLSDYTVQYNRNQEMILKRLNFDCKFLLNTLVIRGYASSSSSGSEHFLKYVPELRVGADGADKIDFEALNKKVLLMYFSAGWCATCKEFTPKLKKLYNASKGDVAILWISRDKSEQEQKEYYAKSLDQSWMFVPFGKPVREFLKLYKLHGLPSVKLIDNDGSLVEEEVKKQIEESVDSPQELVQKWKKQLNLNK